MSGKSSRSVRAREWEYFLQQAKDLSRAIDYLETRGDLNAGAVGYYGVSWGASDAVRALAIEGRIKAAVLADGGMQMYPFERPERDPVHYLPRITIPVLMLNGRYDSRFPPRGRKSRCSGCSAPTPRTRSIRYPIAVTWPLRRPSGFRRP